MRWYHGVQTLNKLYYRLTDAVADVDRRRLREGITLANSRWTAALVNETLGIRARVCYPPASGDYAPLPWPERGNGFLCIGRISPEKELEKVISIMRAVRAEGSNVHLCLVGSHDGGSYYRRIKRLIRDHSQWIRLHEDLSKDELVDLICRHRYGIHGMTEEHFGMALAEMAAGGCIPFAPAGGGQQEITLDERLLYSSEADAVAKISDLLSDPGQQLELHHRCVEIGRQFSPEHFIGTIRQIVEEFLERHQQCHEKGGSHS
jgi:glycosyltransferase involved in cell wall biosynthesis